MGSWLYTPDDQDMGARPWGHCAPTEARSSSEPGRGQGDSAKEGCRGAGGDTGKRVPCGAARTWESELSVVGRPPETRGGLSQKQEEPRRAWGPQSEAGGPPPTPEPGDAQSGSMTSPLRSLGMPPSEAGEETSGRPLEGLQVPGGGGQASAPIALSPVSGTSYHSPLGPGIWTAVPAGPA